VGVVWIPAVLVAQRLVGSTNRKDFWKVVLKGSPDWMRYMVYTFFAYAFVNFLLFMGKAPSGGNGLNPPVFRLARVLGPLDGVLFRCAGNSVLGCKYRGCKPALYKRALGIAERDLLPAVRSTCGARTVGSETIAAFSVVLNGSFGHWSECREPLMA
jgi:hypothetical protein